MDEKALEALRELAAKLGTTSEHLWRVMLEAQKYEAILSGIWTLVCIVGIVACWKLFKWGCANDTYSNENGIIAKVAGGMIGAILVLPTTANFNAMVRALLMPEYQALQQVLRLLS